MFFTGKKGPKTFFSTQKNLFLKIFFFAEKYCSHQKNKSQIFPDFFDDYFKPKKAK